LYKKEKEKNASNLFCLSSGTYARIGEESEFVGRQ
jgi:hypothetical protein